MTVTSHDAIDWVYPDNGCPDVSDSCFTCPLPICRYDVPGGLPVLYAAIRRRKELLERQVAEVARQSGNVFAAQILVEEAALGGCTVADVTGRARRQEYVLARDRAARRMRDSGMILKAIGHELGGRDHSTIIHSLSKTTTGMSSDPFKASALQSIKRTNGVTA